MKLVNFRPRGKYTTCNVRIRVRNFFFPPSLFLLNNDEISFNDLKQLINVTDGNLASHIKSLEENGYIKVNKGFSGRKTNTTYTVTKVGEKAFQQHLAALEKMIKGIK